MKDTTEIIRELQSQAKYLYAEAQKREKAALVLSEGGETDTIMGVANNKYPDYQATWEPMDKIKYIEAICHRFWPLSLLEERLIEIVGKDQAALEFPVLRQFVYRAVRENDIAKMKFEGTRDGFYSTHQDWVEHTPDDPIKYRVNEHYAPDPKYLQRLSEEQRNPERIKWEGIV